MLLKYRLKNADVDVVERLTCFLARSMLIYIGTPMAAAGLWKRQVLIDSKLVFIEKY